MDLKYFSFYLTNSAVAGYPPVSECRFWPETGPAFFILKLECFFQKEHNMNPNTVNKYGITGQPLTLEHKISLIRQRTFSQRFVSIKFGGGVVDARGSLAGNVFSRNKSGAYMRARVTPVNRTPHFNRLSGII